MVQGRGIVDPSNICHGERVNENQVRLRITALQPYESYHPMMHKLMEVESWSIVPIEKLSIYNCDIISKSGVLILCFILLELGNERFTIQLYI